VYQNFRLTDLPWCNTVTYNGSLTVWSETQKMFYLLNDKSSNFGRITLHAFFIYGFGHSPCGLRTTPQAVVVFPLTMYMYNHDVAIFKCAEICGNLAYFITCFQLHVKTQVSMTTRTTCSVIFSGRGEFAI